MILSKERLYQIIHEEVKKRLFEQEEDYRQMSRRSLMKKMGAGAIAAAGFGAAGATLGSALEQDKEARAARRQQMQAAKMEKDSSLSAVLERFEKYINNPAAFRWGRDQESMMTLPGSEKVDDSGLKRGISVLPPSYSIALIALQDRRSQSARFEKPSQPVDFNDSNAQEAKYNLDNFFSDYPPSYDGRLNPDYLNSSVISQVQGITRIPSGGLERGMVLLDPNLLFATPDYVLPENGLTVEQYYNWLYYNNF